MTEPQPPLFDVPELATLPNAGRAEAGLMRSVRARADAGGLVPEDAGLIAGALVLARVLDRAEALPDKTAVYAIAQAFPPYQKALHGLRLPAEVSPVPAPPMPAPADAAETPAGLPDWLSDNLGPS